MNERASEREAVVRYLRAMAGTWDQHDQDSPVTEEDRVVAVAIRSLAAGVAEEEHAEFRAEREGRFELIDGMVLARLTDERDAALTALRPLLEKPFRLEQVRLHDLGVMVCVFCGYCNITDTEAHAPTCPVLRLDALLGRTG